jgi:NAD(P)H-flavin reductase
MDTPFDISGPYGYFTHRRSMRPIVLVATGTGIAPFVSMVRSGLKNFTLLHGVRSPENLYYASLFKATAACYIACLSGGDHFREDFSGRVTDYLNTHLPVGPYDFYLCGRSDMIRDTTLIVDDRFPGSCVYTEIYY